MKFHISKLIIWFKNGTSRELEFLPNKVNIITGRSHTGKTAITEIIDYCFFASSSKISESTINENAAWYSLVVKHNSEQFTFARRAPKVSKVSEDYYFTNEILETNNKPYVNSDKKTLKLLFDSIFSINSNAKIKIGGNFHKPNSKISLRYFQMFNTISGNIIENDSGVFFDKQTEDRYREALPRIFDLAVGIENVENVVKKDRVEQLISKSKRVERKNNKLSSKSNTFKEEQHEIIKLAKKYSIVESDVDDVTAWEFISNLTIDNIFNEDETDNRNKIEKEQYKIFNEIRKLKLFDLQYKSYKKSLTTLEDKIKPIEYLREVDNEIIKTSIFDVITSQLSEQLAIIKKERRNKTPLTIQVDDKINELESKLKEINLKLESYPAEKFDYASSKEKYYFLGQVEAKAKIFSEFDVNEKLEDISLIKDEIDRIIIEDTSIKKELTCRAIEEFVSEYMETVGESLENYQNYLPVFDYKNKSLGLRKPRTTYIENVGSSSNQMFLHLFFTLAMHDIIEQNKSPFIAPYLIIDQPSRPYYGDESEEEKKLSSSDQAKIKSAFKLLDKFISDKVVNKNDFQMIVLEHIPVSIVHDMKNVHIVEVFRGGNALVKAENIS
ncbi:DUF3732 domain-containing protein [Aliivibrio logei]|uniref:DUF3732 domain-containing protein n=1 Tax=Aliivibrio logei TaxID=688 RepID=A0A1B9NZU9_ALILO|nr:DUF3732 domain-containing protein [Aliivibrio logei]OCH21565.1 hypothetical protein A6E04_06770 [Aliivibrio logei]